MTSFLNEDYPSLVAKLIEIFRGRYINCSLMQMSLFKDAVFIFYMGRLTFSHGLDFTYSSLPNHVKHAHNLLQTRNIFKMFWIMQNHFSLGLEADDGDCFIVRTCGTQIVAI